MPRHPPRLQRLPKITRILSDGLYFPYLQRLSHFWSCCIVFVEKRMMSLVRFLSMLFYQKAKMEITILMPLVPTCNVGLVQTTNELSSKVICFKNLTSNIFTQKIQSYYVNQKVVASEVALRLRKNISSRCARCKLHQTKSF